MAKKQGLFKAKETVETPVKVEIVFSGNDYVTLEAIVQGPNSAFKTVEDYLIFLAQTRITKFRRE